MSEQDNRISLEQAIEWTGMWRDKESEYNKYNECNAFLIPISDLKALLAEMEGAEEDAYVRGYLGVEQKPSFTNEPNFEEKMIFVGTKKCVDEDGKVTYVDLIDGYDPVCESEPEAFSNGGGGGLWDFTDPCPPNCDPNSPLN